MKARLGQQGSSWLPLLTLVAGGVAGYLLATRRGRANVVTPTPRGSSPPAFDPKTIHRAPMAKLDASSIPAFVRWVAGTPVSEAQAVRDAVAAARADNGAARALLDNLFDLPVKDIGHHQLLLSIIGEMGRPEFLEPLVRFIDLPPDSITREVNNGPSCGSCISYPDAVGILKSRAVEMLAHLRTTEALAVVLRYAGRHESRVVRLAALDAYTYNHDDSIDSIEGARAAARPEEAKHVGLPRRVRDGDPRQFAEQVAAFYKRYPEELPPQPRSCGHTHKEAPVARATC